MKTWWKSKTLWANIIVVALAALNQLVDVLPAAPAEYVAGVIGILNILLRLVTKTGISLFVK